MKTNEEYASPIKHAQKMHEATLKWISKLNFIETEQNFLNLLLQKYALQLSDKKQNPGGIELLDKLSENIQESSLLLSDVAYHKNKLYILIDHIDEPYKEHELKANHKKISEMIKRFFHAFDELKLNVMITVSAIIKSEKQKNLL